MKYIRLILLFLALNFFYLPHKARAVWTHWTDANNVMALFDDGDYLFVGSSGGLWIIDERTNQPIIKFLSPDGLASSSVTSIKKVASGKMVYGTYLGVTYHDTNGTLTNKADDKFISFGSADGIPTYNLFNFGFPIPLVWDIYVDSDGGRWYATEKGVLYHKDNGTPFNKADDQRALYDKASKGFYYESINSIARDNNGANWYGTRNYGDKNLLGSDGSVIYHDFNNTPLNPLDDTVVEFRNWSYEDDSEDYSWDSSADPGSGILLIGPGNDDTTATINFGTFKFNFYDIPMGGVYVDVNGRLSFYTNQSFPTNSSFPCSAVQCKLVIAPKWNDLIIRNDGQTRGIYYNLITAGRLPRLVITYWNVEHYPSGYTSTFQAILYQGSDNIRFNYMTYQTRPNDPDTIGINFGDGQRFNSPESVASNSSFLFTPIDFSSVEAIRIDSNNKKWYATRWEGIIYHDDNGTPTNKVDDIMVRWTPQELVGFSLAPFYDMAIDSSGKKWYVGPSILGTKEVVYHDDRGTPTDKGDDIITTFDNASGQVYRMVIDGSINWYGTRGGGVNKHNTSTDVWNYIRDNDGIIGGVNPNGITGAISSQRWISTNKAILYHNDNSTPANKSDDTWVPFTSANHSTLDSPEGGIAIDSSGKKWYGTSSGVTYHDDNATPTNYGDDKYNDFQDVDYSMELTTSAGWDASADPGSGTAITFSSCDDATAVVNLGFNFKFYDVEFDRIVVDTNGRVSFVGVNSDYSNPQFPCTENPNCQFVIAPFWDDLSLCVPGSNSTKDPNRNIYYYSSVWGYFVLTFWNIRHYNYSDGNTFQIVLVNSHLSPIEFNYKKINDVSDETIGINKGDGARFNKYTGTIYDDYGFDFRTLYMLGVNEILFDSAGKKWYAHTDGVVYHDDNGTPMDKRDDTMVWFGDAEGITEPVQSIAFQTLSKRWYGTTKGVFYHDDKGTILDKSDDTVFQFTKSNSGLPDDVVNKVYIDSGGNKWYATWGGGIAFHKDNGTPTNPGDDTWVVYRDIDGLPSLDTYDIALDPSNGKKWYGGFGGISVHDDGSTPTTKSDDIWNVYRSNEDEIADLFIRKVFIDSTRNVHWVGTANGISYHTTHFANIGVTPQNYSIIVSWNAKGDYLFPSSVTLVRIYRALSLYGDYKLIKESTCLRSNCSYEDTDFLNGQTHYYWLSVVLQDGKEYRDKLDKVWARPIQQVMPRFYFYSVDPPRSGDVGDYVDYPLYVIPKDGFDSTVTFSLKSGYSLPSGLTSVFIPSTRQCEGGPPCTYIPSIFRVYINSYPTSCAGGRCVIELQASGGSQTKYEKVLLNVRSNPTQSFITHFFYPDPDAEEIQVQDNVEVRGNVFPPCANRVVTSKFTPPGGRGSPVSVTGVTDDYGWFSIKYRPPYAGLWNVLTSWQGGCGYEGADTSGQPPLSPPDLPVSKADTTIGISTNANENTQQGDNITINLKIAPNPGAVSVRVRVINPDGSIGLDTTFTTNSNGEYSFGTKAVAGYMKVVAGWDGNIDYNGTSSELIIPVAVPIGLGIIVEGRSVSTLPQATIDNLIKLAYKTLKNRNIPDSRIYLLYTGNIDADGDGDYDQDADSTKTNLMNAIQDWASQNVYIGTPPSSCDTYGPYRTPLTIYFIGYASYSGSTNYFYMADSSVVYDYNLDTYLDNLYGNISSRYSSECNPVVSAPSSYPVNVIMDFRRAGGFIPETHATDRFLMSSVDSSQTPHFDSNGNVSYSAYFFEGIDAGKYIGTAHSDAKYHIQNLFSDQTPQLDADGDGIVNEINDELQAAQERLEYRTGPDMPPIVEGVKGAATLVQNSSPPPTSMQLWCVVEDKEDSSSNLSVKAQIIPPSNALHETASVITLYPSSPTFTGSYNGFYGGGTYTIMYIATDSYGNSAVAKTSYVVVQDSVAPEDVASVSATWQPGYFHVTWPESSSPDRHGYILYVERNGSFYEQIDVGDVLSYDYYVSQSGNYRFTVKTYDRVPNVSSGASSGEVPTVTEVLYFSGIKEGSGFRFVWEVADKKGVIGYDIFGSGTKDGIYVRLNNDRIPFTGGVENVFLDVDGVNYVYLYVYYEDGAVLTSGPYRIGDSSIPPGFLIQTGDKEEKLKRRFIIVADYSLWDVFEEYISDREGKGFDVELVTQEFSYGGEADYVMEVVLGDKSPQFSPPLNDGYFHSILYIDSRESLKFYLDSVIEFEKSSPKSLNVYSRDGVLWYEYDNGYRIGVGSRSLRVVKESGVLGYIISPEDLSDIDRKILEGNIRIGEIARKEERIFVIGDPTIYIPQVSFKSQASFGCKLIRRMDESSVTVLFLLLLIAIYQIYLKSKKDYS